MIIVKTLDNKITEQINETNLQKYIDLGYVAVSSDEVDMIEENGTTKWKYKSEDSSKYRTLSGGSGAVNSVNGKTGTVVLTQDNIADGTTYKQYSTTEKSKVGVITTTGDGSKYLANDGTYKTVSGGSGVTVYADLAGIKAVDTTSLTSGTLAQVVTLGQFVFNSTSTATGDDITVIVPAIGGGRWFRQSTSDVGTKQSVDVYVAPVTQENATARNLLELTETDVNGRKMINKQIPAVRSKKVVIVGSSVASGQYATTPSTQAYSKLLEVDMLADTTTPWILSKKLYTWRKCTDYFRGRFKVLE